ncbi:MAG: mechanosensitive ion channel family protein, partial [Steroidobacteraceae bacterium]
MVEALLDFSYLGNEAWRWITALGTSAGTFIVLLLLRRLIKSRYARLVATPQDEIMEVPLHVAARTTVWFLLIVAVYAGAQALVLPPKAARLLLTAFTITTFWQVGLWATTAVVASLERRERRTLAVDRAAAGTFGIIGFLARATIWSFVLLLTLDNLGIQIKPLLAGLGIGGIAVALAAQNILGDLFASLSITLDRPFVIGDTLQVDDFIGTVEHIGVKSTRLRSLSGEQIIMPNSNLLASRVRNHTRATDRRVVFTISVGQTTPAAKVRKIPGMIRELIEAQTDVRFDRSHFAKISSNSFDFEAVYIVTTTDYVRHMDILQDVNL